MFVLKIKKNYLLSVVVLTIFSQSSFASYLGNYKYSSNLPGHIDLNPKSQIYQGPNGIESGDDGINRDTPSRIVEKLMSNGRIQESKLDLYLSALAQMEGEAKKGFCQHDLIKGERDNEWCLDSRNKEEINEEWKSASMFKAFDFAKQNFLNAKALSRNVTAANINSKGSQKFLSALFDAIETFEMIKGEDDVIGHLAGLKALASKVYHFIIEKPVISNNRVQAANLVKVPGVGIDDGNMFYSEKELAQLKQSGFDTSTLNPPDNGFWRAPRIPINEYDPKSYNGQDIESLSKVLNKKEINDLIDGQKEIVLTLAKKIPRGGASPKVDVTYNKIKFKMKFITHRQAGQVGGDSYEEGARYFQNSELDAEQVVNNLAAAVGFSIEPSYYKQKVRVYFPENVYTSGSFDQQHAELLAALKKRFAYSWNTPSAFMKIKVDENGKKYFEVRGVHLEMRSIKKSDVNIGSFRRAGLGKNLKREHRAFALFAAWVMDTGVKNENDKGKLVPVVNDDGSIGYKLALVNSDMGASLGLNYPNLYNFNLVKNVKYDEHGPSEIELNYPRAFGLKTLSAIDIDDAKWMARLIGQFTQGQIRKIFEANGYPSLVAEYYSQIMMKKRNQLLRSLRLIGTQGVDFLNKTVSFNLEKEFNGSIAGYDKFFLDGKLTDHKNELYNPNVDPSPRYWGSDFKQFGGDPENKVTKILRTYLLTTTIQTAHSVLLSEISYTNAGVTLFPLNSNLGTGSSVACDGNCFVDGVQFGVSTFLPMRYLVPNPFNDPAHKYWWVEVFRVGAFVGHNGSGVMNELGLGAADSLGLGLIGKFYKMGEYIKIRPIKDEETLLTNLPRLVAITALPIKAMRQSLVQKMNEGEVLIHSSYIGASSSIVFRPLTSVSPINLGPSVRLIGEKLTAHRVTILKNKNEKFLANWSKLKQATARARLNLIDFFIQIPLLEAQFKDLQQRETTYEFDFNSPMQKDLLLANMSSASPSNIPTPLLLDRRTVDSQQSSLSFSLFGLLSKKKFKTKIDVDYTNYRENYSASDLSVEKKTVSKKFKNTAFATVENKIKASINSRDGMYAKININNNYPAATRDDFLDIYERYYPVFPDYFITFNPKAVTHYVGDLETKIEAVFSQDALNQIFDKRWSQYDLCMKYASLHKFEEPFWDCEKMSKTNEKSKQSINKENEEESTSDVKHFKKLYSKYKSAREKFWKLSLLKDHKSKTYKKQAYKTLDEIVDMLTDSKYFKYRSMKFYISLVSKENFHRKASMKAKMEAFPGHEDTVSESEASRGGLTPTLRMLSNDVGQAFELFSDKIHNAVGRFMLNFVAEN